MKPRFNPSTTAAPYSGGGAPTGGDSDPAPPRSPAPATPPRGMRSAWLRLQLLVAGARHNNKLKLL